MCVEGETTKRNPELWLGFRSNHKKKLGLHTSKSEQIENTSKQVTRNREQILKDTFYEMTRWRSTRSSSRSHTANDSPTATQRSSKLDRRIGSNAVNSSPTETTIIHDTFSNFIAQKHKFLNTGLSSFVIKRKGKFEKSGLGELASKIAQTKPLKAKENIQSKKSQQRRLRLRQKRKGEFQSDGHANSINGDYEVFVPRGVSFNDRRSAVSSKMTRHCSSSKPRWDHLHPWQQNQEVNRATLKYISGSPYCLSQIIE